jgi:spermidine synthase
VSGLVRRRAARLPAETPITLSELDGIRYLHFGSHWIQGAMSLRRPSAMVLDYVEQMMGWLLLLDPPAAVLQLGLGAGALTRWGLRGLPQTGFDVVEASQAVIRVAHSHFAVPEPGPRLRIHHQDAARFVAGAPSGQWGVIQADLYDREARGPVCDSVSFYQDCRRLLDPAGGVLVVNLFGEHESFRRNLVRLRRVFDDRLLAFPPLSAGNVVVMALAGPPLSIAVSTLMDRAAQVERRWRLPALSWARTVIRLADPVLPGADRRRSSAQGREDTGLLIV